MKKYEKVVFYSYINSGNHGCEAIFRSTYDILQLSDNRNYIFSDNIELDENMGLGKMCEFKEIPYVKPRSLFPLSSLFSRALRIFKIDKNAFWKYKYSRHKKIFDNNTLSLSTGGDIYCYGDSDWLTFLNDMAKENGSKTVLWGCSIAEEFITEDIEKDLKKYDLITVRESYTYNNLVKRGIVDNVKLFPDPAFKLKMEKNDIIKFCDNRKYIGINLSNHVVKSEKIYYLFVDLIKYIIHKSDYDVVLIPHVFWKDENDLEILSRLYEELDNPRIHLVDREYSCLKLKYIISKCSLFMGARTHSVIAAYSSCVPAIALSYSMKSRGIAHDIFGTEDNMVFQVSDNTDVSEMIDIFEYFKDNNDKIREFLCKKIPEYVAKLDEELEFIEMI